MTIVSIRQPGYLPYMGFFKKIQSSDVFVFLDDVQYVRGEWENRNKIRTSEGSMWLTVPITHKFGEKLNDVKIDNQQNWCKKHQTAIKLNYGKAPFFDKYWNEVEIILTKKWNKLIDLNMTLIDYFISELGIKTKLVKSSDLKIEFSATKRLVEICKKLHADVYLSGEQGSNYLDEKLFDDVGIKVVYENFKHPSYEQIYKKFVPNMSIIDLLFNVGDNAREIIVNSEIFDRVNLQ